MQNDERLLVLLSELRQFIDATHTDVTWSSYEKVEDVICKLDRLQHQLKVEDKEVISELIVLFAPTGAFQEISIHSGWGDEFLKLAMRFEDILAQT